MVHGEADAEHVDEDPQHVQHIVPEWSLQQEDGIQLWRMVFAQIALPALFLGTCGFMAKNLTNTESPEKVYKSC